MRNVMRYGERHCPETYLDAMYHINHVGIRALREYCETKKYPVRHFDRDMQIIRELLKGNTPTELSIRYSISIGTVASVPRRYTQYARECKRKQEQEC